MIQRGVENRVLLLAPSYREFVALDLEAAAAMPPRGSVAVIQASIDTPWSAVATQIERLQRRLATCPVVLSIGGSENQWIVRIAARASALMVRACLVGHAVDIVTLRETLCDLAAFPRQMTHWLTRRQFGLTPSARALLEIIGSCDLKLPTFSDLLRSVGAKERLWRSEFTRSGLGSPGAWSHIVRMVRIATVIQAHPEMAVSALAGRYGFYDVAHLRHRLDGVTGASPSVIRKHLGWEWMMFSALRRHAIAPPRERERERERERTRRLIFSLRTNTQGQAIQSRRNKTATVNGTVLEERSVHRWIGAALSLRLRGYCSPTCEQSLTFLAVRRRLAPCVHGGISVSVAWLTLPVVSPQFAR